MSEFRFAHPEMAILLLAPLLVAALWIYAGRLARSRLERALEPGLRERLVGRQGLGLRALTLLVVASVFLAFAGLRPQFGFREEQLVTRGADIVFAVDVSRSMLAEDASPSRLARAKRAIVDLVRSMKGDRVALVAFAGAAFLETPLTQDYDAFLSYLPLLDSELIPLQGTNIEHALAVSLEALGMSDPSAKPRKNAAIVMFSDGEEVTGQIQRELERATRAGVRLYTIGVGTEKGAPIPTERGFRRTRDGHAIISSLQPEVLRSIAAKTGGAFFMADGVDMQTMYREELGSLERTVGEALKRKIWRELYQWPLAFGLFFLFLGAARGGLIARTAIAGLLIFCPSMARAQSGIAHFERGEYQAALDSLKAGEEQMLKGAALYRLGKFAEANEAFAAAAAAAKDDRDAAAALYNSGNALTQLGRYEDAIKAYEASLVKRSDDHETQENLAYVKKLLREQQEKQQCESEGGGGGKSDNRQEQNQQQKEDGEQQQQQGGQPQGEEQQGGQQNADQQNTEKSEDKSRESQQEASSGEGGEQSQDEQGKKEEERKQEGQSAQRDEQQQADEQGTGKQEQQAREQSGESGDGAASEGEKADRPSLLTEDAQHVVDAANESFEALRAYRKGAIGRAMIEGRLPRPEKDW